MICKITKQYLRSIEACYDDDELTQLWDSAGLGDECTPLEFAECGHPKKADLLWVLLRPEIIPEKQLHLLACRFAEDALNAEVAAGRTPDPRSWEAIACKRRWVAGEATIQELEAAREAAWEAAGAAWAAREAAWEAAWEAAGAAGAAWEAAVEAAWEAAGAARAAWEAAGAAVVATQLAHVIETLKEANDEV